MSASPNIRYEGVLFAAGPDLEVPGVGLGGSRAPEPFEGAAEPVVDWRQYVVGRDVVEEEGGRLAAAFEAAFEFGVRLGEGAGLEVGAAEEVTAELRIENLLCLTRKENRFLGSTGSEICYGLNGVIIVKINE